jgi:ABC-type oligopeptide transport system substrate-binding subunit
MIVRSRKFLRLNTISIGAVLFLFVILLSCGDRNKTEPSDIIYRGLVGEPNSLDPHKNTTVQGHRVLLDLFEGLLRHDANGELEGGVAESWTVSDDGRVYRFNLNTKSRWSNGDTVTAHDFVSAFRRLVSPSTASYYASFLSVIDGAPNILSENAPPSTLGVKAVSDSELEVRLSKATAYFPTLLTHPAASPIHRSTIENDNSTDLRPGELISNGAYVLSDYALGHSVSLTKNNQYRESQNVSISNVTYRFLSSGTAMFDQFRTGELHTTESVPMSHFDQAVREYKDELKLAPLLGVYYYGFNMTKPMFRDNPDLRRALSMAIDRRVLVEKVVKRGELPAFGLIPPNLEGYDNAVFSYAELSDNERISQARKHYEAAGYSDENPAKFELRYNIGDGEQRIALAIQDMWKQTLGVEASLVNEEFRVFLSNISAKQVTEVFRNSWVGDYPDPNTFLEIMTTGNPNNMAGYSNSEFDKLVSDAQEELDSTERMQLLRAAETQLLTDTPVIPLYFYVSKHLVAPEISGWSSTAVDYHPTRHLSFAKEE